MSEPVAYFSIQQYLESISSLQAKIDALGIIITNMLIAATTAATTGQFDEYRFDDGQSKIEVVYRDMNSMTNAIIGLQKLQTLLRATQGNNAYGRMVRFVPGENLPGYYGGEGWSNG